MSAARPLEGWAGSRARLLSSSAEQPSRPAHSQSHPEEMPVPDYLALSISAGG